MAHMAGNQRSHLRFHRSSRRLACDHLPYEAAYPVPQFWVSRISIKIFPSVSPDEDQTAGSSFLDKKVQVQKV